MSESFFPFSTDVIVRGYEIDSWGHVNNAVYLNWLEHARWEMSRKHTMGMLFGDVLPLVRHIELDFRAETLLGDTLRITLWPRTLGNTSFVLGGAIRIIEADEPQRRGTVVLLARTVLACVIPGQGKAPVPEAWRQHFLDEDPGPEPPV